MEWTDILFNVFSRVLSVCGDLCALQLVWWRNAAGGWRDAELAAETQSFHVIHDAFNLKFIDLQITIFISFKIMLDCQMYP